MKKSTIIEIALNSINEVNAPAFKKGQDVIVQDVSDPIYKRYNGKKGKIADLMTWSDGRTSYAVRIRGKEIEFDEHELAPEKDMMDMTWQDTFGKEKGDKLAAKQKSFNEADYAVGGMFKAIADIRANTKKLFALHDKLQSRREHAEDQIDADMQSLHNDRQQLQLDMENDPDVIANVERGDSGPVAEYGEQLDALDDQIAQLMNRKTKWAEKAKAVEDQIRANHKKLGELSSGAMSALRGENMTKSHLNTIIKEELINVLNEANTNIEDMAYELVGELALDKVLKRNKIDKFDSDTIYTIKIKALEILKGQV